MAFYGSRGLGKTSLLRAAQREAEAAGYLTVWITGRDDVALAPDLARWLGEEVRRGSFGGHAKALLHSLDKVQVELGIPGAKVGVEASGSNRESAEIERSLKDAGKLARTHGRHGLTVFVDEFQGARLADRRSLLIALQHFDGAPDGAPVAIVAAGLPSMLAAVPEAATFGERTDFVEVGLLGDVAVAEALRMPADELGVTWSDDAVLHAIEAAGGYPHHVQLIGDAAWEAARPETGGRILGEQVRRGAERAETRMSTLFASRLAKLGAEQRRFLAAMAEVAPAEGSSGVADGTGRTEPRVSRADIAARLGVPTEAVSRPRQQLIDRGLIESAGHGALRFTVPGFAAWLRGQTDPDDLSHQPADRSTDGRSPGKP